MTAFDGKTVLITGGGTGIGRAAAEQFLAAGARVFVIGRRSDPLESLAREHGDRVGWLSADIGKPGDAARIVQAALARFETVDVLVNNSGTYTNSPLVETPDEAITHVLGVNVFGTLAVTREAVPALVSSGGCVVNVTSTLARGVMPSTVIYSASKAALEHATRVLAAELGPRGVRVNAIAPGVTATQMNAKDRANEDFLAMITSQTPLGRVGAPEEVARAILLLASPSAGWVTGQVLQAAGGLML